VHLFGAHFKSAQGRNLAKEFQQLRDMLTADTNLNRIGTWGVNMSKPHFVGYPNEQQFPKDRFEKYQSLLNEVGSVTAIRKDSSQSDPAPLFYLWSWGTAVSSRHYNIGICWLNQEPTNQIPTLDGYHSHSENGNAYRHIDSHWYFWTDL
jgi:hypothetical protein